MYYFNEFFELLTESKTNVYETKDDFKIEIELPGLEKSEIKLEIENDHLIINCKKCKKSYMIPNNVDRENITAKLKNGILTIVLTKSEKHKPKIIEIK